MPADVAVTMWCPTFDLSRGNVVEIRRSRGKSLTVRGGGAAFAFTKGDATIKWAGLNGETVIRSINSLLVLCAIILQVVWENYFEQTSSARLEFDCYLTALKPAGYDAAFDSRDVSPNPPEPVQAKGKNSTIISD